MFDIPHTFLLDDTPEGAEAPVLASPPAAAPGGDAVLLDAYSRTVSDVVERVGAAVVRIDIRRGDGKHGGSGSGVIVSPDGLILTNSHVVQGGKRAEITTLDGRNFFRPRARRRS